MDTLKSLMSNMADTITRQVSEQVKKAMDIAGSAQPVPAGGFLHQPESRPSFHPREHGREVMRSERSAQLPLGRGHPILHRPPLMTAPPRPQNARKYCEFHEQSGHTMTECRELKKALHEGPRSLRQERVPTPPPTRDEECSTEIVTTIAGG
ncbi:hypothetical protein Cgig2_024216 [Carnegiea gigantea]|uniref:Uncharacterized protein n=1 Tax=Carnegiea gigantea TaxID=171969 RepID=A0A9Q1GME4_9CARY|nr:hypothetical protein Cgig2_024216 [Carnegiea gigantea]